MTNTIKHQGIVESTDGSSIQVRIVQTSACAACSIKGHCTSAEVKEKLIEIANTEGTDYKPGDQVWVLGEVSMGARAVLLAFILQPGLYCWLLYYLLSYWWFLFSY